MDFSSIPEDVLEKARACKTAEELIALVREEGVELTDDDIAGITGGDDWCGPWGCTKVNITDYL